MTIATTQTVGEIAAELPGCTREFEKLGIDYCCGGNRTLGQACTEAKLPIDQVLERLKKSAESAAPDRFGRRIGRAPLWLISSPTSLPPIMFSCAPSLRASRRYRRRWSGFTARTIRSCCKCRSCSRRLSEELSVHLMKEEQILFPYVLRMEESAIAGEPAPPAMFGTVMNPIGMMMREHDGAGDALRALRSITQRLQASGRCLHQLSHTVRGAARLRGRPASAHS